MTRTGTTILGVHIDDLTPVDIMRRIDMAVAASAPSVFAYTNIHTMNAAAQDQDLRDFLESADLNILDGQGVKLGGWILGKKLGPALGITRLIWDIFDHCERANLSVFLLGSTDEHLQLARARIQAIFPKLSIAGCHHGYFDTSGKGSEEVVRIINASKPSMVFTGLGTPSQEKWVAQHRAVLQAPVTMLVGGCLDIIAGKRRAAPVWIATIGLEWLFRLLQEPTRLWRRYLIGIPCFLGRVLLERSRGDLQVPSLPRHRAADAHE